MSKLPSAKINKIYDVNLDYPRSITSSAFNILYKKLLTEFRDNVDYSFLEKRAALGGESK